MTMVDGSIRQGCREQIPEESMMCGMRYRKQAFRTAPVVVGRLELSNIEQISQTVGGISVGTPYGRC